MESMRMLNIYKSSKVHLDQEIYSKQNEEVKVGYLNVNGLLDANHGAYINNDKNIMNLDILVLAET